MSRLQIFALFVFCIVASALSSITVSWVLIGQARSEPQAALIEKAVLTNVASDAFTDPYLQSSLEAMEIQRKENDLFRERARNTYGERLNLVLLIAGVLGLVVAAIKTAQELNANNKDKPLFNYGIVILSALAGITSIVATTYIKPESELFLTQNRSQYSGLAQALDSSVDNFILSFREGRYTDENINEEAKRTAFAALFRSTVEQINNIKESYRAKYDLEVNIITRNTISAFNN